MPLPWFVRKWICRSGLAAWLPSFRAQARGAVDYLPYYADRLLQAPLDVMNDRGIFPEPQTPDTIHLAQSAPRFDALNAGTFRAITTPRSEMSPWGLLGLRQRIAVQHAQTHCVLHDPHDEVLITHGASGAFSTFLDTFINPGTGVVVFEPGSPLFTLGLAHRRARVQTVPTWMEEGRTRFHLGPFVQAMKNAQWVVMADPNNPTGGCLAPEDLEQIVWWAKHYNVMIYLDESFSRYRYDDQANRLGTLPNTQGRLLVANSVSKGYGLSALRIGWLTGHRHLVRAAAAVQALTTPYISPITQEMALSAMETLDAPAFEPLRQGFAERRRYVYERLRALGLQPAWPTGGHFFWVPVSHLHQTGRSFADALLADRRVIVTPGDAFGPASGKFIRLSYALDEGRLREGLLRLSDFLQDMQRIPEMPTQPALVA